MATLVIKNLPDPLHARLKRQAEQNHRSLNKEAKRLIEAALSAPGAVARPLPPPIRLKGGPLTARQLAAAITEGRD